MNKYKVLNLLKHITKKVTYCTLNDNEIEDIYENLKPHADADYKEN